VDLGPTGSDGRVTVVDTEPATFLSIGVRGAYGGATVERGLQTLNAWLGGQDEWVATGEVRALYYNGPYIPDDRKWAEVQVPVRPAAAPATVAETSTSALVSPN
jgi:hypothetical protein